MADAKTNYLERKVLDHVLGTAAMTMPSQVYIALLTTIATDSSNGVEVTGGSYSRKAIDFNAAVTDGTTTSASNTAEINFNDMPYCIVVGIALYDASTSGNMLYYQPLSVPKTVAPGDDFIWPAGSIKVREL